MQSNQTFYENISNLYGVRGQAWLTNLPFIIKSLSDAWCLTNIDPVNNMTFHYVATATLDAKQDVVLKIGFDEMVIQNEKKALEYFDGMGSIQLLAYHPEHKALLLQQAVPGTTLKSLYPKQIDMVMDIYVKTMHKLHENKLPHTHTFEHIENWLTSIDKVSSDLLPNNLLHKARSLKNSLLKSIDNPVVLHGDLHHDNILQHGNSWLAIDPKGIVGDVGFEIAAFDFIHPSELSAPNINDLFAYRIHTIARKSGLSAQLITNWVFVRLILTAVWLIEDNLNPSKAIDLATLLLNSLD
jgi:streptomycin 6-kinase